MWILMLAGGDRMVPAGSYMPVLSENAGAAAEVPGLDVAGTATRPPLSEHSGLLPNPTSLPDSQALWDNSSLDALEDSIIESGQKVLSLLHHNEAITAQGTYTPSNTEFRKKLDIWVGPFGNYTGTTFNRHNRS